MDLYNTNKREQQQELRTPKNHDTIKTIVYLPNTRYKLQYIIEENGVIFYNLLLRILQHQYRITFMKVDCDTIVSNIGDLPPTPVVALRVLRLVESDTVSAKVIAEVVSHDPAISARLLKTANSPLYYTGNKVKTLDRAIVILGETKVRQLVLESSMRGITKTFGLVERNLWEDSIGCAVATRLLSQQLHISDPEESFLAGLFRHVGKNIMLNHNKSAYKTIVQAVEQKQATLLDAEKGLFAFSHEEIGAAVMQKWNFPESLIISVRHHNRLDFSSDTPLDIRMLTAIVNIAGAFCYRLGIGRREPDVSGKKLTTSPGARLLGLEEKQLLELLEIFATVYKKERAFFLA